jgi:molybdopterin/thiamine biosynthesis adenylyltransferase/rhodanese-related sulfurtransferase
MAIPAIPLSEEEITRYARHLITPEVGLAGQLKLKQAKVLVVGTGGLGSPISIYLAAAGVGKLGLMDSDVVDASNLQRQILHGTADVGRLKLDSARDTLRDINPLVEVETHNALLARENALEVIPHYDIVVDGTDNVPSRYLLSDACVLLGKPLVHGSIFRFQGQLAVFCAKDGPCFRCAFPEPPPPDIVQKIAVGGVIGVQPGIIGCLQALEAIKLIVGNGKPLVGRLLVFDGTNLKFREVRLQKDPACAACGTHPTITRDLPDYEAFCGLRPPAPSAAAKAEITSSELAGLLREKKPLVLLDVREPEEFEKSHIPGARSIPLAKLLFHVHEFTWADDIVVYSGADTLARQAAARLRQFKFRRTRVLAGGFTSWREAA